MKMDMGRLLAAMVTLSMAVQVGAQDGVAVKPWVLSARVGGQYTDNRDGLENDKESNLDFFVEPRADFRYRDGERTLLDLFLVPQVKWHSNPRTAEEGGAQNDSEIFGSVGAELVHQLSPRATINVGDALNYNDDPSISEGGASVRRSASHLRNDAHMGVEGAVTEKASLGVKGSSMIKRYKDDEVAAEQDEDILDGEAYGKYKMGSGFNLLGLIGWSDFRNDSVERERGSSVMSVGVGVEKVFSPDFLGKVTAGYQHAEYDDEAIDALDSPNARGELTFRAAAPTRFRVGAGYGIYAPYVRPYSLQKLTSFNGAVDHDLLANRLTVSLVGQVASGDYEDEGEDLPGGTDDLVSVGVRGDYRFSRNWSLQAGYAYENWDSDVRESFSRNLVDVAVKAQL
jgi:hypothetical protein